MEEIKLCPFCGKETGYRESNIDGLHTVLCLDKDCLGYNSKGFITKYLAIKAWNIRPSQTEPISNKEECQKAYGHGVRVGTYLLSGLGDKYAPLTFDAWYEENITSKTISK